MKDENNYYRKKYPNATIIPKNEGALRAWVRVNTGKDENNGKYCPLSGRRISPEWMGTLTVDTSIPSHVDGTICTDNKFYSL